jgi:Mor family transcriptional regulator
MTILGILESSKPQMNTSELEKIADLFRSGNYSTREIAYLTGYHSGTIKRWLRKAMSSQNIQEITRIRRARRNTLELPEDEIVHSYCSRQINASKLAQHYGCSKNAILKRLRNQLSIDEIKKIASNRLGIDDQDIILLYRTGNHSASSIAFRFGCDVGTIIKRIRKNLPGDEYNLLKRENHRRALIAAGQRKQKSLPEKQIAEEYMGGYRGYELAKKYNCSGWSIQKTLRKYLTREQIEHIRKKNFSQSVSGNKNSSYLDLPESKIIDGYKEGSSSPELAKKWHCSEGKIKAILRRNLDHKYISEQSNKIRSKKLKGRPKSEDFIRAMKERRGEKSPNFGKRLTQEQRLKKRITARRGPAHHAWKGGISPESVVFIGTPEWKEVATKVRYRDKFVCRMCGKDHVAVVHHFIPRSCDPAKYLWFDLDNLITLCTACHLIVEPKKWGVYPNWRKVQEYYQSRGFSLPPTLKRKLSFASNNTRQTDNILTFQSSNFSTIER